MSKTNGKFRAPHAFDEKANSDAAAISEWGESLTIQSMAEDTDINVMLERYRITGIPPNLEQRQLYYGDFTEITDFKSALLAVKAAQETFDNLPAKLRAKFENNPQLYLEYCENPANLEEMRTLGLAKPLPAPHPGQPGMPLAAPPTGGPAPSNEAAKT